MSILLDKYRYKTLVPSDINEHLPTLYKYAKDCKHITECGVRDVVSSYAFASALKEKQPNKLILVDPEFSSRVPIFLDECENENVSAAYYNESDLECPLEQTDLLFIDTWHIYGQLKRELARWSTYVNKYIILHDTEVDGVLGESVRNGDNIPELAAKFNMPAEEIAKGLWPAVEEFLASNSGWKLAEKFENNNGLTILSRTRN